MSQHHEREHFSETVVFWGGLIALCVLLLLAAWQHTN